MDLTQYVCIRCGLMSTYVAHLLSSSKLHSAPAGSLARRPNCPHCTLPLKTMEEVLLEEDAIRKDLIAKHEAQLAELAGARHPHGQANQWAEDGYRKRIEELAAEKREHPERSAQIEAEKKRMDLDREAMLGKQREALLTEKAREEALSHQGVDIEKNPDQRVELHHPHAEEPEPIPT